MAPVNNWIKDKIDAVREYFEELIDVDTPEDALQLDKFVFLLFSVVFVAYFFCNKLKLDIWNWRKKPNRWLLFHCTKSHKRIVI